MKNTSCESTGLDPTNFLHESYLIVHLIVATVLFHFYPWECHIPGIGFSAIKSDRSPHFCHYKS